jgi:hypothetical protein
MRKLAREGVYLHPTLNRIVEHHGFSTRIYWSKDMTDFLRRQYATTTNQELAECLGLSQRTITRKARELGLKKDADWLRDVYDRNRRLGHASSRVNGNKGWFTAGHHASPDTEFKRGRTLPPEQRRKQTDGLKRWYRLHPHDASVKAAKAWVTRRANQKKKQEDKILNN